jgi:hypothetical protein
MGEWVQGGLLALGCHWSEGGWCMPTLLLSLIPLWCCGLRCPWGLRTAAAACFLGVCNSSGCPLSDAAQVRGGEGLCFSSGTCGWLTRLLFVRRSVGLWCCLLSGQWSRVGQRLWSLVHTPPRHGSAVQQAVSKASTSFWSASHDFARHDRSVPAKGRP